MSRKMYINVPLVTLTCMKLKFEIILETLNEHIFVGISRVTLFKTIIRRLIIEFSLVHIYQDFVKIKIENLIFGAIIFLENNNFSHNFLFM